VRCKVKILQNPGTFETLQTVEDLKKQLLVIEMAGRTSYQSQRGEITQESAERFIRMLIRAGHYSVLEHSVMTVKFFGCSRGFTHELVRHRLSAFTQESTRYVDYAKGEDEPDLERFQLQCVLPAHRNIAERIAIGDDEYLSPVNMLELIERYYRALRKAGWRAEDARQILPIATESEIVVSSNFRQWRHIFALRTAKDAHWEIRHVMCLLLEGVKRNLPVIVEDFEFGGRDKNGVPFYEYHGK